MHHNDYSYWPWNWRRLKGNRWGWGNDTEVVEAVCCGSLLGRRLCELERSQAQAENVGGVGRRGMSAIWKYCFDCVQFLMMTDSRELLWNQWLKKRRSNNWGVRTWEGPSLQKLINSMTLDLWPLLVLQKFWWNSRLLYHSWAGLKRI